MHKLAGLLVLSRSRPFLQEPQDPSVASGAQTEPARLCLSENDVSTAFPSRTAEAVDSAASTAALENLDIVWLSPPGSLRSLKEMGWSSEGGGDESSVGPPRALPYDISTYGTTVYIACCGAFVGETLIDVGVKDLFIGATAIDMIFSKMYAMGLSLRENAGVQATIVAIRALVKNASARDFADLSIEVGHLTAIDSSELQNTYMDFLTFAGDFGVGTVGCSAETLGVCSNTPIWTALSSDHAPTASRIRPRCPSSQLSSVSKPIFQMFAHSRARLNLTPSPWDRAFESRPGNPACTRCPNTVLFASLTQRR